MSGMYNMVFGQNPAAPALLGILITRHDFDPGECRIRDAWVERHGDAIVIRVHTRIGGGNRPDYAEAIAVLQAHPWYRDDADMDFDNTYADFYFTVDPAWEWFTEDEDGGKVLEALVTAAVEPVDMAERWQEAIAAIGNPPTD